MSSKIPKCARFDIPRLFQLSPLPSLNVPVYRKERVRHARTNSMPSHQLTRIAQYWISLLLAVYGAAILAASRTCCSFALVPVNEQRLTILAPCGWLADKSPNRRLPLLIGLIALTGATLMLCLGTSIGLIVAGRVLQGVSAAMVWIVGLALLADTFSPGEIGTAMGYATIGTRCVTLILFNEALQTLTEKLAWHSSWDRYSVVLSMTTPDILPCFICVLPF